MIVLVLDKNLLNSLLLTPTAHDFIDENGGVDKRAAFDAGIDVDDLVNATFDLLCDTIDEDNIKRWVKTWQKHNQEAVSKHMQWATRSSAMADMFVRYERDFHQEIADTINADLAEDDIDVRELFALYSKEESLLREMYSGIIDMMVGLDAPIDKQDEIVRMCTELPAPQSFAFIETYHAHQVWQEQNQLMLFVVCDSYK